METLKTLKTYKLIIAIVTLIVLVNYQIENVYYSYIIEGGRGRIGIVSGLLMLFIYGYISSEIALMFFNFKYGVLLYLILTFVQPWLVVYVIYPKYFNEYSNNVKQEMLEDSHVRIGYVYRIRWPIGKGTYHKEVYLGIDKSYKSLHRVSEKKSVKKGDTLLLRVSDEYHRVCEVLKWNPTHEEIERYKTPRKFKSFDSRTGKIIEEEVPDKVEGKEVVPSISVELDGVEQELQLEEHEHDEGVESADIVEISNEVEDESIELEEFEYEFQSEKKKQVEENRVIDVRLNVIEKHE